jgi:hypothetical protein
MAAKFARGALEKYSAARYEFARAVASMAEKPDTFAEALVADDAHVHLRALMADRDSEATRVTATATLAALLAHDGGLADALAADGLLGELVAAFERPGAPPAALRAVLDAVRAVAAHSPTLAAACLAQPGLLGCVGAALREPDAPLREAAAATVAVLAAPSPTQAHALVNGQLLPPVVACLAAAESAAGAGGTTPGLRRAAARALAEVARHDAALATAVVDAGALPLLLAPLQPHHQQQRSPAAVPADARLRRLATAALCAIVAHSEALADAALACGLLPRVLDALLGGDGCVGDGATRRGAADVLREVCKHSAAKAAAVADAGGLHALAAYATSSSGGGGVDATSTTSGSLTSPLQQAAAGGSTRRRGATTSTTSSSARLPAVMALGYASAFSPALAQRVLDAGGADAAKAALTLRHNESDGIRGGGSHGNDDHCRAAAV